MVYSQKQRENHWCKIIEKFFDKKKGYTILSTNDINSVIGDKEIRLLMAYRPKVFEKEGLSVFPLSTRKWILVNFDDYHKLEPIKGKYLEIEWKMPFKVFGPERGSGEQQYLLNAINSGLIKRFLGVKGELLYTIGGKQRSSSFSFSIGDKIKSILVENPQIEIDAGLEGKKDIVLIEAKPKLVEGFRLKKIYFPLRAWDWVPRKNKHILFLCYEPKNEIYYIWKYVFKKKEDITSLRLLKAKKYKIKTIT